jgi:RimJ/RimL family protein N-acetyltransferase
MTLEPFTLRGSHVALEPLDTGFAEQLVAAADIDRSSYGYTQVPESIEEMTRYINTILDDAAHDRAVPFVQRRTSDGTVVGCTRFMHVLWWPASRTTPAEVEIGGTWLAADAQRGPINTEAKLLLLTHAFEVWHVHRTAICTDATNERSRRAIERLGATFEGILRNHRPSTGFATVPGRARHSAMYSVLPDEWPAIKARLRQRLARSTGG